MPQPTILPFTTKGAEADVSLDRLTKAFDSQRAAFAQKPTGCTQRMLALKTLHNTLRIHQDALVAAISEDFGGRSREETLTLEVFALYSQINHARRNLKKWMRRITVAGAWFLQPARAFYQYQPLGVVGLSGTWTYPLLLTISPLIDALAAGNRVMLKPSEMTPRTAQVIAKIIESAFPPDSVTCVQGGEDVSQAFASLPFDHLLFTGSARVGQQVLKAASANFTPVTLELGGKSPVILHETYPLARAVQRIITAKLYNAGQTCVAPDYVLVPSTQWQNFELLAKQQVAALYPALMNNPDYTRIINAAHYERLTALVADAARKGARVVSINPAAEPIHAQNRVFPPTFIFEPSADMAIMREEIFGPVLPVISYRTMDEAIAFVNARPHPLALYYFDENKSRIDELLTRTMSGGVTVNDCLFHLGQPNLPFGGVGPSGMGHYHGFDGFVTFSKKRAVMLQTRWAATALLHAPFRKLARTLIQLMIKIES
jgi:coniferyl-aldehyde dehydrogenase